MKRPFHLKGLHKIFEAPQKSVKINFKLIFILIQLSEMHWVGRIKNSGEVGGEVKKM